MSWFSNPFQKKLQNHSSNQEVGKSIMWPEIVYHVFRVLEFDRAGTKITSNGKVKPKNNFSRYGNLIVESPMYSNQVRLPIVHYDDFLLAASVYDDANVLEIVKRNELLVTYIPKNRTMDGFAGITHAIHYVIVPANTIELYYHNYKSSLNQEPERIFGSFTWEGEIRVGVNLNPNL